MVAVLVCLRYDYTETKEHGILLFFIFNFFWLLA
jgi:hypothetical protein